jgi:hypothetical protein
MPAIQPNRLKQQCQDLAEHFSKPSSFVRELTHLFEFYADRAQRPNQSGKLFSAIPAFNISQPVFNRILSELIPRAEANPEQGLELAEALWAEPALESRLLGVNLLGHIPAADPGLIIGKIDQWQQDNEDETLRDALATNGLTHLRREASQRLFSQIGKWISQSDSGQQKLGLVALHALLAEPHYENLPAAYKIITPLAKDAPSNLRPYLLDLIQILAKRSAKETALFLRDLATTNDSKTPKWLIRYSAGSFPPAIERDLRSLLRGQSQ